MCAEIARLEHLLARALRQPDPVAALALAARDPKLSADLRARLERVAPDGLRVAALLVVRLRFERALHGSRAAAEWFERDPASFARAFKSYHAEVAPTAALPSEEARLFERWVAAQDAPALRAPAPGS